MIIQIILSYLITGTCGETCKLAATLRIVGGRDWSYSLENPYTAEWQELAEIITEEVGVCEGVCEAECESVVHVGAGLGVDEGLVLGVGVHRWQELAEILTEEMSDIDLRA